MAKEFSHDGPILTFHEGVVIRLPRTRFGEFNQEVAEQARHAPIDIFRAIVGMEPSDEEGKRRQQIFQGREQIGFTDLLHGADDLKLGHLIDGIDMIDAFLFIPIPLVHGVETEKAGLAVGGRFPTFTNAGAGGAGLLDRLSLAQIPGGFP